MKDNIRTLVTIGFLAVLCLMFLLAAISLTQLHSINESMENLVEVTNNKTAAANAMRDAIRQRSDSLKSMRLSNDIFEREEEHQRFINHARKYRVAREKLVGLGMDEKETALHDQLQQLTKASQPYNDSASEMLMSNATGTEIDRVMEQASALQGLILEKLDELVKFEQENTEQALANSRKHYAGTRQLLFILTGIALLFSILLAHTFIVRVSEKNRQLA